MAISEPFFGSPHLWVSGNKCQDLKVPPFFVPVAVFFVPTGLLGLGRFGSFVGPLAMGLLLSRGWPVGDSFVAIGAPALCAALFTSQIGINPPERTFRVSSEKNHQPQARNTL